MATHSSILAWRIPWMEEPGRLQSTGSLSNFTTSFLPICFCDTVLSHHVTGALFTNIFLYCPVLVQTGPCQAGPALMSEVKYLKSSLFPNGNISKFNIENSHPPSHAFLGPHFYHYLLVHRSVQVKDMKVITILQYE